MLEVVAPLMDTSTNRDKALQSLQNAYRHRSPADRVADSNAALTHAVLDLADAVREQTQRQTDLVETRLCPAISQGQFGG